MSTIRWKNKRRKGRGMSEDRIERFLKQQNEENRQPRTRRKINGEWIEK